MKNNFYCIGEVIVDKLPDCDTIGGAPFNVATHLKRFGNKVTFISSVGSDWDGDKIMKIVDDIGLSKDHITRNANIMTGIVNISLDPSGAPSYEIMEPVAWDFIELKKALESELSAEDILVFGTLAQRNNVSRMSIRALLESNAKKVYDVNLRKPFYTREIVEYSLERTDILKLNEDELEIICEWLSIKGNIKEKVIQIVQKFDLEKVLLTMGESGALSYSENTFTEHGGYKLIVKDTVGAGDSFLAAYLSKLNDNIEEFTRLSFANAVGAFITTQRGALPIIDINYINRIMLHEKGNL